MPSDRERLEREIYAALVAVHVDSGDSIRNLYRYRDAAITVAEADFARLKATIDHMRASAFAAINPANWQTPETSTDAHCLKHYGETLAGIADGGEHFGIMEEMHAHYMGRLDEARREEREACRRIALDDAFETGKEPNPDSRTNEAILTARRIAAAIWARGRE